MKSPAFREHRLSRIESPLFRHSSVPCRVRSEPGDGLVVAALPNVAVDAREPQ
jgi:hypothetical protein